MRRMIAGFLAVILLAGSGCKDKKSVPSGILPMDKMETVLWDMIQADQYSALYLAKDSSRIDLKAEQLKLYDQVFRLHQVSRDEFRKSFQYYQAHPELNQMVYDSLLSRGNRLRAESYNRPVQVSKLPVTSPVLPSPQAAGTLAGKLTDSLRRIRMADSVRKVRQTDSVRKIRLVDSLRRARLTAPARGRRIPDSAARARMRNHLFLRKGPPAPGTTAPSGAPAPSAPASSGTSTRSGAPA